jgi:RHS repeat-associated protein
VLNSSFQILNAYAYTLQASGHRTQMVEATGRTVSYTLDNQYRLTQETISGEANPLLNGTSDWEYDLVGNRLSQLSDIDQIANASETYSDNNCSSPAHRAPARLTPSRCFGADAEHRPSTRGCASWLDSHDYDSNGNTIRSAQLQQASVTLHDTYDWRNRLITRQRSDGTIIEIVYDGFGDRMEKTVRNASFLILNSTKFLVDRNSLTGYAQVVEEIGEGDELQVIYTYGLDLISQDRRDDDLSGNFTQSFYLYDGLGSIRALTDSTGAITDTYTYDAWGVLINQTSSLTRPTTNAFRFTGEQWDEDLGMYFLRARYLNVTTGRFHTMDTFEGVTTDPITLHKYLYANANPAMFIDPSGYRSILAISLGNFVRGLVLRTYSLQAITTRAFLSSGIQSVKLLYASRYLPSLARALEDFGNQARGLSDFALARRLYNTSNAVDQVFLGALSGSIVGVSASVALGPVALLANLIGVGNAVASYGETVVEGVGDAATAAGISCNVKFDITSSSTRRLIVDILTFNIQPDLLVNAAADSYVGGRTGDLGRFLEGQMFFQQNFCNRYR